MQKRIVRESDVLGATVTCLICGDYDADTIADARRIADEHRHATEVTVDVIVFRVTAGPQYATRDEAMAYVGGSNAFEAAFRNGWIDSTVDTLPLDQIDY